MDRSYFVRCPSCGKASAADLGRSTAMRERVLAALEGCVVRCSHCDEAFRVTRRIDVVEAVR